MVENGAVYVIRRDAREVRLERGQCVRIGRHASNDLVLDDVTVSRFHARVSWPAESPRPLVLDLASANGTSVDGAPVRAPVALEERSIIVVGDLRLQAELDDPALIPDDGLVCRLYTDLQAQRLQGGLGADRTLADLLLDLERTRRTGTLTLRGVGAPAAVTVALGRIVDASFGSLVGLGALRALLARPPRGTYSFGPDIEPHECPLDLGARELLAGGAPATDRIGRVTGQARPLPRERATSGRPA